MTDNQIIEYEYCKKHLIFLKDIQEKQPFGAQKYGCGQSRPSIEFDLERLHVEMHDKIHEAIEDTRNKINKIIEEI